MVNGLPKIIAATPHRHDIIERLVRDYVQDMVAEFDKGRFLAIDQRSSFSIMTRREGRSRKRQKTGRPEPLKASNLAPMLSTTASTAASALLAQQDQAHPKQANPTGNTHKVLGSPLSCCFFNSSSTLFIKEPMSTAAIDNEMYLGSRNPDAENLECHGHTQETKRNLSLTAMVATCVNLMATWEALSRFEDPKFCPYFPRTSLVLQIVLSLLDSLAVDQLL
ncbi:hypothetical protein QL093DRAFT_2627761 [Fusarium oxysporum]|nr:hypothetical protein QL093DRAFT_2627761 [Fusarium oxysporum]